MPPTTSIPRFLLPQRGAIWRTRLPNPSSTFHAVRTASTGKGLPTKGSKPLVLERPSKFNPPSHGARLRKDPPRYPGPQLSEEEKARQKTNQYPHMMPAQGTFMHWFLTNTSIHMYITLGTLFSLAGFVWYTNFTANSPFAEQLPSWPNLFFHPIIFFKTWGRVIKLDADRTTAISMEKRKKKVEDVAKRAEYRKAHGLDKDEGFGGWTAKSDEALLGPGIPIGDHLPPDVAEELEKHKPQPQPQIEKPTVKKWLGIW